MIKNAAAMEIITGMNAPVNTKIITNMTIAMANIAAVTIIPVPATAEKKRMK